MKFCQTPAVSLQSLNYTLEPSFIYLAHSLNESWASQINRQPDNVSGAAWAPYNPG